MKLHSNLPVALLCTASVIALSTAARAQDAAATTETVVVTGSRVISDAANSPTPLTVVTTAQLQATTPSNIPDALNKLPVFQGSSSVRNNNNASANNAGNVLNLRNFGSQRTLILLDGHRVAPSNSNGTVDIDVLPQMLMTRVDVVTGGASAVYGSDAVTGVVNFVLDKRFTGVKVNVNSGISTYADGASYKAGIAMGTDLLGGRMHIEAAGNIYHADNIKSTARPDGAQVWTLVGLGTAASPFGDNINARLSNFSYGGKITCAGCSANGQQFIGNGVIGPFNPGTPTGTQGVSSGGDGSNTTPSELNVMLATKEFFARASYNIDDTTSIYVQGTAAEAYDKGGFQNNYVQTGNVPNTFFKTNPFLPAALAPQLAGTSSTFQLAKYINNLGTRGTFETDGLDRNFGSTVGIDGTLWGAYDWDVYYTHGDSRLQLKNPHNQNNQKMYAAIDAVTNAAGNVVCYVTTTTEASRFPGCVPLNPFGPTTITPDQYNYFTQESHFIASNVLDDFGGSISGQVWDGIGAGPVKAALSGEYRTLSYGVVSNALPTDQINCTGLRICSTTAPFWQANIAQNRSTVSTNVMEFAAEAEIPLLKDLPLIQSLSTNVAGRYTDYSTSGAVETWKIGLDYHVNDDIRFRATTSVDIRAPTLNDLFSPQQITASGYADAHTGNTNSTTRSISQGNPNLVPEVARTYTAGVVLTPSFLPGFTLSMDYYAISLKNAIANISPVANSTQSLCEVSGGTSPFCALYVRPLPFSNTTSANYPTAIISQSLNAALNQAEGWDIEANYGFEASDLMSSLPGSVNLRLLANIQPLNETTSFPGAALTFNASSKGHVTGFVSYKLGNWSFDLLDRWLSGYSRFTQFGQVYTNPRTQSRNYDDVTITRKFMIGDSSVDGYLSIQNIVNVRPPISPINIANPGIYYLGQGSREFDGVGRFFTIGVRANL